ncbi:MAG TPA: protein-L-isoaspartate(D-aspartate) O-methyltransferase [Gemmataceae bacterium]|nr:protein-L-isoaspartate(D-aspartate) O-methyltransferase [Gemmataceae bacterium]
MRRIFNRTAAALILLLTFMATRLPAQTPAEFEEWRHTLVDKLLVPSGIKDPRVVKSMRDTPRHEFMPANLRKFAYYDMGLPIGEKQTISSPLIVAQMTQALHPKANDKVLEIGTGSGYQTAVLSPLVKDVYTIEIVESLGKNAKRTLERLGYKNVHAKVGDGYLGWPEFAPFSKIIATCSPEKVPQPLIDQLADGGTLVAPVGERYTQTLYVFTKKKDKLERVALLPTVFVPMTGKAEATREHKPDPANPRLVNGGFEEDPHFVSAGGQPGWYYERQVTRRTDDHAPEGKHFIEFKNTQPNLGAHLIQGFAIDGRKVNKIEVSGWVKTDNVVAGMQPDQAGFIRIRLFDEQRQQLSKALVIGPFVGTSGWHKVHKTFDVPKEAREGIIGIGLFGATGVGCFDQLELKKVAK